MEVTTNTMRKNRRLIGADWTDPDNLSTGAYSFDFLGGA